MVTRIHSVDDFVYFSLNSEYESNNTIITRRQFKRLFIRVFFLLDINSKIKHFYSLSLSLSILTPTAPIFSSSMQSVFLFFFFYHYSVLRLRSNSPSSLPKVCCNLSSLLLSCYPLRQKENPHFLFFVF